MLKKTLLLLLLTSSVAIAATQKSKAARHPSEVTQGCSVAIETAKEQLDSDGNPRDESQFLVLSIKAIKNCKDSTKNWKSMNNFIQSGVNRCEEGARQQSNIFKATCFLKIAEAVSFISQT